MRRRPNWTKNLRMDDRAVSPAISTVIITCSIIVMVLVAMVYAQSYLNTQMAQNEFSTNKQFMLTTGLQIDDIAWTIGRTQTVRYSCRYSQVQFEPQTLTYSIDVIYLNGTKETVNDSLQTGVLLYDMPTSSFTLGNNYFEPVYPAQISFLQQGPSAPVSQVYVMEKLPMRNGNYTRVVVAPSIRMINSTIGGQTYVKYFLPLLVGGANPELSQSVTLIGTSVMQYIRSNVAQVSFTVSFPKASDGFDSKFFPIGTNLQFGSYQLTVPTPPSTLPPNSVVEFYVGVVTVSIGEYV
ncbi:MAG TPA: hypothetical protein VMD05_09770 [Candidatus Nanoarchaeia archaeon]|nr:hypothetical protein [Candidatus Nanoarchaeia archaeon]